jgi:MmyB-like transcription regulator ligand binding domain
VTSYWQHHVDRAVRGRPHAPLVLVWLAGQPHRPHPVPEPAGQVLKHLLVPARSHHPGRAHGQRDRHPGAAVIPGGPADQDGLSRLEVRRDQAERTHLRALARSPRHRAFTRETVPDAVRRMVASLAQPAYVTGRRWDVLAWNAAAADVITDFGQLPEEDRNVLSWMLTEPGAQLRFGPGWAREGQRMVAQFRATHDLWARDPAFEALITRLRAGSPEFAAWWESHDVRRSMAGQKVFYYPDRGPLRFEYVTFPANDDPALKLVIYTPA